jgi:hypothetical protein
VFMYSPSLLLFKPIKVFNSVSDMFLTIIRCFKEKAFWYDKDGYFEVDWDLYKRIGREMNPTSEYWKPHRIPYE